MKMIFRRLSIPIAKHKTMGPLTCIEYLGIISDTKKLEARMPQNKIDRICKFINSVLQKSACTKQELLQLLGHRNFAIIYGRILNIRFWGDFIKGNGLAQRGQKNYSC
jgi:hypothetical protein